MRKVSPYKSQRAAMKAIDNGGRFYNLLTKADDGLITSAELSKAAGVIGDAAKMHLYLAMSLFELPEADIVINALSEDLASANQLHKPLNVSPAEANQQDLIGKTAIVTGVPHYVKSNDRFSGFIFVPIMTNNVTTMMMVPIFEHYDLYELRDHRTGETLLVAHGKSSRKLPSTEIRLGGFLKELKEEIDSEQPQVFLEACYYT